MTDRVNNKPEEEEEEEDVHSHTPCLLMLEITRESFPGQMRNTQVKSVLTSDSIFYVWIEIWMSVNNYPKHGIW